MQRRDFITLLSAAAVSWPVAARAEQPVKLATIGYMGPNTPSVDRYRLPAFVQRLGELGWIEGRTVTIEYRWAEGRSEHLAKIAAEFVQRKVDVILTAASSHVRNSSPRGYRARIRRVQRPRGSTLCL